MRVAFYTQQAKPREESLRAAIARGCCDVEVHDESRVRAGYDLHMVISVGAPHLVRELEVRGEPYLLWDKGYNRDFPEWWRVSYNAHQPVEYLARARHLTDRMNEQGWFDRVEPWREAGPDGHVLLAGASPNYHAFMGLPDPTVYAQQIVNRLLDFTQRRIVYRPKPQWRDAQPVAGAEFSHHRYKVKGHRIRTDLSRCHVMVTHGSSACLEALLAGVPTICLGRAAVLSISSSRLEDVRWPRIPMESERLQFLANLAYCQWSLSEIASGYAWPCIMAQRG